VSRSGQTATLARPEQFRAFATPEPLAAHLSLRASCGIKALDLRPGACLSHGLTRRLAAILAADMVGYRLMRLDEAGTVASST
jgi:class 3 adenylate cyclase